MCVLLLLFTVAFVFKKIKKIYTYFISISISLSFARSCTHSTQSHRSQFTRFNVIDFILCGVKMLCFKTVWLNCFTFIDFVRVLFLLLLYIYWRNEKHFVKIDFILCFLFKFYSVIGKVRLRKYFKFTLFLVCLFGWLVGFVV